MNNYKKLFSNDVSVLMIKNITKGKKQKVYDISVEDTESFFGNYYPILLHNSSLICDNSWFNRVKHESNRLKKFHSNYLKLRTQTK